MGKTITSFAVLSIVFLASQTMAAVKTMTVIYDGGGDSIRPYMESIQSADQAGKVQSRIKPLQYDDPRYAMLPVVTPELKPGRLPAKYIPKKVVGTVPMVLVGADQVSYRWLQANKETFKKLNAVGIAVNVSTGDELEYLEGISGVRMSPVNGSEFAKTWRIKNYPVLITSEGVYQ